MIMHFKQENEFQTVHRKWIPI